MIRFIYVDPKIEKKMGVLRKSGAPAAKAADRAEEIIDDLRTYGAVIDETKNVLTKHGELRIEHCKKYDLGSGYRLVTIKQGENLFLTQIGSHDECNQWIENNRSCSPEIFGDKYEMFPVEENLTESMDEKDGSVQESLCEETWETEIDEKYLRRIFCGITGEYPENQ